MNKSVKKVKTNTMVFTIVLSLLLIFAYKINFATTEKKFEHYIFFAVTKDSTDVSLQDLSRGFLYESFRGGIIFDVDQRTHDVQGNPVNTLLLLIPVFIIIVSIIEKKKDLKSRVALADFKLLL